MPNSMKILTLPGISEIPMETAIFRGFAVSFREGTLVSPEVGNEFETPKV